MDIVSIFKEILGYLKPLSRFHQSFHFSCWIIPVATCIFWYYSLSEEDSLEKLQENVAIVPMHSIVKEKGSIISKNGTLVFVKASKEEYRIALRDSFTSEIWTSLDRESMRINENKVFVSKNGVLNVNMPLYGKNQSVGVVIDQEVNNSYNQQNSLNIVFPLTNSSKALLFSVLLSFSFGYGLIFSRIGWWHYEFPQ